MHGIPANLDLRFLVGQVLTQVCLGEHQVILRFGDTISIYIGSGISHRTQRDETTKTTNYGLIAPTLAALLGSTIVRAARESDTVLSIAFSNGETLELHDDSKEYESIVITAGDQTVVI